VRDVAKYAGGVLLAALLLWWVVRGADPVEVWEQLKEASWSLVALSVLLNLGHNIFRVWRWRVLLQPVRAGVRFRPMFVAVIVGYMTSWAIPGRLGELVRPLLLSAREKVPLGPCLGSIVADRMLDAITVVTLFVLGTWLVPLEGRAAEYETLIRTGSLTMAAMVALFTVAMLLASSASGRFESWIERRAPAVRWIVRTTVSISTGVRALRSPRLVAELALHSALAWMAIAASTWFGVRAVGAEVSFGAILVILPLLVLGVAVPTPGGAGSYHGAVKIGLMLFGISEVLAVSAGFLMHALVVVPVIVLGLILVWVERISWRDLMSSAAQIRTLGRPNTDATMEQVAEGTP
jgi:uncharacterized protein (TIRG00374 family)